ncbi:MAG: hypothetical protein IKZ29_05190 [Clostridiales bacterium]|nr:hypothetical protein [Clostridiales bacterium]MBR4947937.1 hypothetical protein [Clostridiales bacterium]
MDNNNNIFNDWQNYQPQQAPDPQQQYQPQYQQPQYQQPVYQQPPYQQQPQYQQPVYQQPVYQQPAYQQPQKPVRPIDLLPPEERAARKKKANTLCIISLILHFSPFVIIGALSGVLESLETGFTGTSTAPAIVQILGYIGGGAYIASWVFMIIARAKYSESVFAKVLMWVYLGILSISIIGTIVLIYMCAILLNGCH